MTEYLLIYGAGGLGVEILDLCYRHNKWSEYRPLFIDDFQPNRTLLDIPVISFSEAKQNYLGSDLIIAVGDPLGRKKIFSRVAACDFSLPVIVDSTALVSKNASLGRGCIICPHVIIGPKSKLGENTLINAKSIVGHDAKVGQHSVLASMVNVGGHASIGENSMLGMNSSISPKGRVGKNCLITMQSLVLKDIPDNVIAVGNPARASRRNFEYVEQE